MNHEVSEEVIMGAGIYAGMKDPDEIARKMKKRINGNSDCSGFEHDTPPTSKLPDYGRGVISLTLEPDIAVEHVNNSINMINDINSRRRGGFVRRII